MAVITVESIKEKLTAKLEAIHVKGQRPQVVPFKGSPMKQSEAKDVSNGCGYKFEVVVVSGQFEGKPLLQRHRLVNSCLEEELKTIHAFSQKTYTPDQWHAKQ